MKIGIISDTHDRLSRTRYAVQLLAERGAELLVHCGDWMGPDILAECSALPLHFVFGNNDCVTTGKTASSDGSIPEHCIEPASSPSRCSIWNRATWSF